MSVSRESKVLIESLISNHQLDDLASLLVKQSKNNNIDALIERVLITAERYHFLTDKHEMLTFLKKINNTSVMKRFAEIALLFRVERHYTEETWEMGFQFPRIKITQNLVNLMNELINLERKYSIKDNSHVEEVRSYFMESRKIPIPPLLRIITNYIKDDFQSIKYKIIQDLTELLYFTNHKIMAFFPNDRSVRDKAKNLIVVCEKINDKNELINLLNREKNQLEKSRFVNKKLIDLINQHLSILIEDIQLEEKPKHKM